MKLATSKPVEILETLSHYNSAPPPHMIGRKHFPGEGRKELDYMSNILIFFEGIDLVLVSVLPASEYRQEKSQVKRTEIKMEIQIHMQAPT